MTREEEILKAARNYVSGITLSSPSNVLHFEAGAKWADEHPNIVRLWHNPSKEPQGDNWEIICIDDFDSFWVESKADVLRFHNNWDEYTAIFCVKTWAYVSDLLPKQFGNSKSDK